MGPSGSRTPTSSQVWRYLKYKTHTTGTNGFVYPWCLGEYQFMTVSSQQSQVVLTKLSAGTSYIVSVMATQGRAQSEALTSIITTGTLMGSQCCCWRRWCHSERLLRKVLLRWWLKGADIAAAQFSLMFLLSAVPAPPTHLRVVNVTDTKALLQWTPSLGKVDRFIISYESSKSEWSSTGKKAREWLTPAWRTVLVTTAPNVTVTVMLAGNSVEHQLRGLQRGTVYTVKVLSQKNSHQSMAVSTSFTTAHCESKKQPAISTKQVHQLNTSAFLSGQSQRGRCPLRRDRMENLHRRLPQLPTDLPGGWRGDKGEELSFCTGQCGKEGREDADKTLWSFCFSIRRWSWMEPWQSISWQACCPCHATWFWFREKGKAATPPLWQQNSSLVPFWKTALIKLLVFRLCFSGFLSIHQENCVSLSLLTAPRSCWTELWSQGRWTSTHWGRRVGRSECTVTWRPMVAAGQWDKLLLPQIWVGRKCKNKFRRRCDVSSRCSRGGWTGRRISTEPGVNTAPASETSVRSSGSVKMTQQNLKWIFFLFFFFF